MATFNPALNTYTVKTIKADGSIDVLFDCDASTQNLSGYDLSSVESLTNQLDLYTLAYISGKTAEVADAKPAVIPADVSAILNKKQTAEAPVAEVVAEV